MAAWFVFLHFFLVPLCWYAVSERQMLLFFAGGLVGADKHLFQRVSLINSMTLPMNYIFVLLLANVDVIPKQKQLSTVKNTKENVIHGKTKRQQIVCFITRWRVFYKYVQLVQGAITLTSITIILLFNFEKKHLIRLSVSSKLKNYFPLSFYCLPCFVLGRKTEKKPYN